MKECYICHKRTTVTWHLCPDCYKEYVKDGVLPEWLKFLVDDIHRESMSDVRRADLEYQYGLSPEDYIPLDDNNSTIPQRTYDPRDEIDSAIDVEIATKKLMEKLTKREREVLELLLEGYNEEGIAEKLGIHQPNVSYFCKRIREKAEEMEFEL